MKDITPNSTKVIIPDGGWTILVRDEIPYQTWGNKLYFTKSGENPITGGSTKILVGDIKSTDKIYHFPDCKDPVISLSTGRCMNRFLIKTSEEDVTPFIKEQLDAGKVIGLQLRISNAKYHIFLENNIMKWKTGNTGDVLTGKYISSEVAVYEFNHIYELGKWLLSMVSIADGLKGDK